MRRSWNNNADLKFEEHTPQKENNAWRYFFSPCEETHNRFIPFHGYQNPLAAPHGCEVEEWSLEFLLVSACPWLFKENSGHIRRNKWKSYRSSMVLNLTASVASENWKLPKAKRVKSVQLILWCLFFFKGLMNGSQIPHLCQHEKSNCLYMIPIIIESTL